MHAGTENRNLQPLQELPANLRRRQRSQHVQGEDSSDGRRYVIASTVSCRHFEKFYLRRLMAARKIININVLLCMLSTFV